VTENKGKRTPGVDGVTFDNPEMKMDGVLSLKRRGYKPQPLRRVEIPKSNGKTRLLGIPTMKDRAMQALHHMAVDPVAESLADRNSYGFRKARSTEDARDQAFNVLAKGFSAEWVLEGDIKACFDNIDHHWLESNIPMDKEILKKWLTAGVISKGQLFPTTAGTPQGGIISPTLANLALDGMERMLNQRFRRKSWRDESDKKRILSFSPRVNFVRYADDFIITGISKEILQDEVLPAITEFLLKRGLNLSLEKTRIVHIDEGFDFLGWNFRKYKGKLLIKPSNKNVKAFMKDVRDTIDENKTAKTANLIAKLNPKIKGWANYHKGAVAKEAFATVDEYIWMRLWAWAKRRHPQKRLPWIKKKYFMREGNRDWVFFGNATLRNGEPRIVQLAKAADVPIVRHSKIKVDANPYSGRDELYFERREFKKILGKVDGKRRVHGLWLDQNGICPICRQRIDLEDEGELHIHHLIPRCQGGKDTKENTVLLHPECHRQVHFRKEPLVTGQPRERSA
jgi:RNA-directed DNA polymerase